MPNLRGHVIRLPIAASNCLAAGTLESPASPVTTSPRLSSVRASPGAEASQNAPGQPLARFEFISEKDEASRRRARAHVMRDFMRKRRQREVERYRASQGEGGPSSATTGQPPPSALVTPTPGDQPSAAGVGLAHGSPQPFETYTIPDVIFRPEGHGGQRYGQLERSPSPQGLRSPSGVIPSVIGRVPSRSQGGDGASLSPTSPLSTLSPSPVDPFASLTLPLSPSANEQELIHHCK